MNTIHAHAHSFAAILLLGSFLVPAAALSQGNAGTAPAAGQPAAAPAAGDPFETALLELSDGEPIVRRRGADRLGRLRDPRGVPPLLKALEDADPFVRSQAVDSLGLLRAGEARAKITAMLGKDEHSQVRQQAAIALSYFGDIAAEDALIAAMADAAEGVRFAAARTLGSLRSAKAAPKLAELMKDPSAGMRRSAAASLGQIRSKESVPALQGALQDEDVYVRREAVKALSGMGSQEGIAAAVKPMLGDADALVRIYTAQALVGLGDNSGEPVLAELLKNEDTLIRQQAASMLGMIGSQAMGLPALVNAMAAEKNPSVQKGMEFAVAQMKARLGIRDEVMPAPVPEKPAEKGKPAGKTDKKKKGKSK